MVNAITDICNAGEFSRISGEMMFAYGALLDSFKYQLVQRQLPFLVVFCSTFKSNIFAVRKSVDLGCAEAR